MSLYNSSLGILKLAEIMEKIEKDGGRVHFLGVFGAGQRGLARILLLQGIRVSGSDIRDISEGRELVGIGLEFYPASCEENVDGVSLCVYTLAIDENNPEYRAAKRLGIPTVSRAELLAFLFSRAKRRIAVAGSHGKSTVTAMLDHILMSAGAVPTVVTGASLSDGEAARLGGGEYFIAEACEYKDSFLKLHPTVSIVNNLELDHTDYFKSLDDLKRSFIKYASRAEDFALINIDDPHSASLIGEISSRTVTFGASANADWRYSLVALGEGKSVFAVYHHEKPLGEIELNIPGTFNVSNALAAIAALGEYGVDFEDIRGSVSSFLGIKRRLEYLGEYKFRSVFYDYAHHPTEIAKGISAVRSLGFSLITVVFKSHTYSRTAALFDSFVKALSLADYTVIGEIYAAREENIFGISPADLVLAIGPTSIFADDEKVPEILDNFTRGAIIIMGAADMNGILKRMKIENRGIIK